MLAPLHDDGSSPPAVTAEQARQLTDRIKVAVDGTWLLILEAYTSRAWAALGYTSWDDYCTREFGTSRLRLPREERQEVVASLRESGMSVRAIASATGHDRNTIRGDLRQVGEFHPPAIADPPRPAHVAPDRHRVQTEVAERGIAYAQARRNAEPANDDREDRPTVTGTDGKTYRAQPSAVRSRPPLPPQFADAAAALGKVIARFERLTEDDRYRPNRATVADRCAPEIRRAVQVLGDLLLDLAPQKETN